MSIVLEGDYNANGLRAAIVVARFNEMVTRPLAEGALDCLTRHGVEKDSVPVAWVPGAFEIPLVADKLAATGKYDTVICLGAVIRGETPHFDQVVAGVTSGVSQVSLNRGIPVLFGVLTTDTVEQALNRSGLKSGNKGWETALGAIETVNLVKNI